MAAKSEVQGKKWLREASMRRLSLFVKNKTELIGNAAQLGMGVLHPDTLEKSGLSTVEIFHLEQWVAGVETGRQCMLAILDSRLLQNNDNDSREQQTVNKEDFKPVDLIRSLMNLPEDFLCDGGYIYETVFQRAPAGVVREALQMLVQTAFEKSPSQLGIEQINLAIKQLRLNNLGGIAGSAVNTDDHEGAEDNNTDETKKAQQQRGTASEETFRLQIMIELIRIHIVNMNKKRLAADGITHISPSEDSTNLDDFLNKNRDDKSAKKNTTESDKTNPKIDMHTIEKHLRTPLKVVFEQAGGMSADELEGTNSLLKPYLKQLSSLKTSLAAELKDLQDSRAFLALGLSSEASDEAIKKAYRMLAIRLHPDKPGGDTARFQALQDSYQEIMRKRKADSAERAAMEEVRNRYRDKPTAADASKDKTKSDKKQDTAMGEDELKHQDSATEGVSAEEEVENQEVPQEECSDEEEDFDENGDLIVKPDKAKSVKKDKKDASKHENSDDIDSSSDEASIEKKDSDGEGDADTVDEAEDVDVETEDNDDLFADHDIEEVMKGLDGSEDVEEVFRRLSEAKSKTQPAFGTANPAHTRGDGAAGAGTGKAPVPVSYESEVEHARAVVKQIGEILQRIKKAAGEVTQLAQLNIKWQKLLDKAMEPGNNIKEVFKVLTASTGPKSVLKGNKNSPNNPSNVDACALQQAIMPVELICDWAQQVSALAMELPNLCGVRYAAAASGNKAFIMAIERAMHLSLGALKTVLQLINSQEQLASCVRRVKDSIKIAAENEDIQELLLEMIRTGVKSNVITISSTVDRVVETAMAASEVRDQVQQLMKDVERMERAEVKRRAAEQESQQAEDDYCEEDKEALRKCREDRRDEDRNMRRQGGEDGAQANKDGTKGEKAAESGSLDDLKDKIRLLQVQLKVQHVQALQSMNSEVVLLQGQIIKELQALPFVTSVESLFTDSARVKKTTPAPSATSAPAEEPRDFKTSILTLVADLIDSACHALRNDLLSPPPSPASPSTPSTSTDNAAVTLVDPRDRLNVHFGWMKIVLADGSSFSKTHLDSVAAALAEQASSAVSADTEASASESVLEESVSSVPSTHVATPEGSDAPATEASTTSEEEVSMRLALLPDYRAKTLYLASLVDIAAVHDIIGPQLLQRLEEILLEGKECIARDKLKPVTGTDSTEVSPESAGEGETSDLSGETKEEGESEAQIASIVMSMKEVNLNDIDDSEDLNAIDEDFVDVNIHDIDESEYAVLDEEIFCDNTADASLPLAPEVPAVVADPAVPSSSAASASAFPPSPPSAEDMHRSPPIAEDMHRSPGGVASSAKNHSDTGASCKHSATSTTAKGLEGENLKPNNCSPMQA